MRNEFKLFLYLIFFFFPMALIYGYVTHFEEKTGLVGLTLTGLLCAMIAVYLAWTGSKLPDRPEDNPEAVIADGAGDYGIFAPYSWWPLLLAGSGAIVFLGLAVGWWLFMIGAVFLAVAVVGWTFEYFHGEHAL